MKTPVVSPKQTQDYSTLGMDSSVICYEQLITSLCPFFSKTGTGVDVELGVGVDQETHLCKPTSHVEMAACVVAVARLY
jgi:hypothetical protein